MIEDRLKKLEEQISANGNVPEVSRAELMRLLAELRSEIAELPSTHADDARSIATFAEASAYEATRQTPKPKLLKAALAGLTGSVEEFETSHPDLAATLNRLSAVLANMGM
ncbi:MAG: DUF4404 family protein [Chthoniobacteraceae bacterium]|nr:DUF4404 family protein [Chthoniobacteraceae bacterium]